MKKRKWSVEERSAGIFVLSLLFCALLCFALAAMVGTREPIEQSAQSKEEESIPEKELPPPSPSQSTYFLASTPDAGLSYQNRLTFFGESTTAHLRSRGVLSEGVATKQVLCDESGTKRLSSRLPYESVIDPESGESVGLLDLLKEKQPSVLVLSFGLNGLTGYAKKTDTYKKDYNTLLSAVRSCSPSTKIILQTIYPVAKEGDHFDDPDKVNCDIEKLNTLLPSIAAEHTDVFCVDTASVLKGSDGSLDPAFDNGDGYHLNVSAYRLILQYLRTHAWEEL